MRFFSIPALFPLALLAGCAATPAPKAVEAATQQHSVNRYELHGSPDKIALLVDSETGRTWKYDSSGAFVPVVIQGLTDGGTVRRYNPVTGKIE